MRPDLEKYQEEYNIIFKLYHMELRWINKDSFKITMGKNTTIITNPYKALPAPTGASTLIYSREDDTLYHKVANDTYLVNWPGEYEVADTLITGVELDEESLLLHTAYNIHTSEDISIVLLGSLTKSLVGKQIEELGSTDILLLDIEHMDPKEAHKLVDNMEPRFTIPVYESKEKLEAFLKASGTSTIPEAKDVLKLLKTDIPEEGHSIVLLSAQG